jgi:hypothetical protein
VWFRQSGSSRRIDPKIHPAFVQRGDVIGIHESTATFDPDDEPVKNVLRWSGDYVVDGADLNAIGCVHRDALFHHLVGDRIPLVHATTVAGLNRSSTPLGTVRGPRPDNFRQPPSPVS